MIDVFNTPFETSLRIMVVLYIAKTRLSTERIIAMDFISIYGKDFGVSEYNLHGENNYRFSEYALKRERASTSIKQLVLMGHIKPHCNKSGLKYSISKSGISLCESLNDEYAEEFAKIVKKTNKLYSNYSDRALTCCINEYAVAKFGGENL